MRGGVGALLGVLALVVVAGVASAAAAPVVTAGLDQNVILSDTVYLDGSPTHVPEGELASMEWSIEAPNGTTFAPRCAECDLTSFKPSRVGRYAVTLTATSESGVTRSDTLYVDVAPYTPEPDLAAGPQRGEVEPTPVENPTDGETDSVEQGDTPAVGFSEGRCSPNVDYQTIKNQGGCGSYTDVDAVRKNGEVVGFRVEKGGPIIGAERTGDGTYYVDGAGGLRPDNSDNDASGGNSRR